MMMMVISSASQQYDISMDQNRSPESTPATLPFGFHFNTRVSCRYDMVLNIVNKWLILIDDPQCMCSH